LPGFRASASRPGAEVGEGEEGGPCASSHAQGSIGEKEREKDLPNLLTKTKEKLPPPPQKKEKAPQKKKKKPLPPSPLSELVRLLFTNNESPKGKGGDEHTPGSERKEKRLGRDFSLFPLYVGRGSQSGIKKGGR